MAAEMSSHYPELSGNREKVFCGNTTSFILLLALQSVKTMDSLNQYHYGLKWQNICHSDSVQSFEKTAQEGSPHQLPTKSSDDNVYAMSEERHGQFQTWNSWHLNSISQEGNIFIRIWLLSKMNHSRVRCNFHRLTLHKLFAVKNRSSTKQN